MEGRTILVVGAAGACDEGRRTCTWGLVTVVDLETVDVTNNPEFWAAPEEEGRGGMGFVGGGGGVGPPEGGLGRVWAKAGSDDEKAMLATKNGVRKNFGINR